MEFGKVAVTMGSLSAERDRSLISGRAVLKTLLEEGVDAEEFDTNHRSIMELKNKFDRVFLANNGRGGEDGTLQGALELMGIPYTGSGVLGSAVAMDKVRTKYIWQTLGLPVASHSILHKATYSEKHISSILVDLGLPLMVKPAQEGCSMGTLMVDSEEALMNAIENAFQYDHTVLVEQYIVGREFSVCILSDEPMAPVEIKLKGGNTYFSTDVKNDTTLFEAICPPNLTEDEDKLLRSLSKEAFRAIACSHYGRVDVMMDKQGRCYLLEINTAPGLGVESVMPVAGTGSGLTHGQLCLEILKGASVEIKQD